jgi:hypothetical protein
LKAFLSLRKGGAGRVGKGSYYRLYVFLGQVQKRLRFSGGTKIMRKKLTAFVAALSLVLMGWGVAMAATSALQNVPGGGGFAYFHASAAGDETLFNLQNVDSTPILVHISIWDSDSDHVLDFNVPLSGWDNWGCSITGDGTSITISPQTPCYYTGGGNGCFTPIMVGLPEDPDSGMQIGYISYVISAGDSGWYGGDGNGDPRNDPIWTLGSTRHWDVIFTRVALLNPVSGSAIAMNGNNLQGFVNVYTAPGLVEAVAGPGGGWNSIADVPVPFLYNCDLDIADIFPTRDDASRGLDLDSWELYLTDWINMSLITDDQDKNGIGELIYNAVGSASQFYIARFNESPAIPSNTVLVTVFPANGGTSPAAGNPACGYASRNMGILCYDDNGFALSTVYIANQVDNIAFGDGGITVFTATSGECRISVDAPLVGFTYTEAGNYADIYPLIDVDKWVYAADYFNWFSFHVLDPAATEVIEIGIQETY